MLLNGLVGVNYFEIYYYSILAYRLVADNSILGTIQNRIQERTAFFPLTGMQENQDYRQ